MPPKVKVLAGTFCWELPLWLRQWKRDPRTKLHTVSKLRINSQAALWNAPLPDNYSQIKGHNFLAVYKQWTLRWLRKATHTGSGCLQHKLAPTETSLEAKFVPSTGSTHRLEALPGLQAQINNLRILGNPDKYKEDALRRLKELVYFCGVCRCGSFWLSTVLSLV